MANTVTIIKPPLYGKVFWNGINFVYTPQVGFTGKDYYIYTISDGLVANTYTEYIESNNIAPLASNISLTANTNDNISIDVSSYISDTDGLVAPLRIIDVSEPFYGIAKFKGTTVYYESYGFNAEDSIIYTVSDGQATATAIIYLTTINGTNIKYPRSYVDKLTNLELDVTTISHISGNWDTTYSIICANSAKWMSLDAERYNAAAQIVEDNSADWDEMFANKSLYDDSKSTVVSNSATWNNVSSLFNTISSIIETFSANWENTYTTVSTYSARWEQNIIDYTNLLLNYNSYSANWDSSYTTVCSYSAGWDKSVIISLLQSYSADWETTNTTFQNSSGAWETSKLTINDLVTDYNLYSGNWQNSYTIISTYSADWNDKTAFNLLCSNSANWKSVYDNKDNYDNVLSIVSAASADWNVVQSYFSVLSTEFITNSANWNNSYTIVSTYSANWEDAVNKLLTLATNYNTYSSNWENAYTIVSTYSAGWDVTDILTSLSSASSDWNNSYNILCANSANWEANIISMNSLINAYNTASGNWQTTYTTVCTKSASWNTDIISNILSSNSANWNNAYNTITSNSANWDSAKNEFANLSTNYSTYSANWQNTYNIVSSNSGSWDNSNTAYSIITASSANWNSVYDSKDKYDTLYTTVCTYSGGWQTSADNFSVLNTTVNTYSGLWSNAYSVVTAKSGSWDTNTNNIYSLTNTFSSNSANWETTYNTICTQSAGWDSSSIITTIVNESGNWDDTHTKLVAYSANWENAKTNGNVMYTEYQTKSGDWQTLYTLVSTKSADWGNQSLAALIDVYSDIWNTTYTTVCTYSAAWNAVSGYYEKYDGLYSTVSANSATWYNLLNNVSSNSAVWLSSTNIINSSSALWLSGSPTQDYTADNLTVYGTGIFYGTLSTLGAITEVNSNTVTTTAFNITNTGFADALVVTKTQNTGAIATFNYNSNPVLYVDPNGRVGINTSTPNKALTIVGDVSATGTIYANIPVEYTTFLTNSSKYESAYNYFGLSASLISSLLASKSSYDAVFSYVSSTSASITDFLTGAKVGYDAAYNTTTSLSSTIQSTYSYLTANSASFGTDTIFRGKSANYESAYNYFNAVSAGANSVQINYVFDGGGDIIDQTYGIVQIPASVRVISWVMVGDVNTTTYVELLSSTYDNFPNFVNISGTTNTNTDYLKLNGTNKSTNSTLTNWLTTTVVADSLLKFSLLGNTKATSVNVNLKCVRI